jgi:putative copper resistance protein D
MTISLWVLFTLASRIFLYASVAGAIGGIFASLLLAHHRESRAAIKNYIISACIVGLITSLCGFIIQVGSFANNGISGMLDNNIISILLQTSVGSALTLQVIGFIFIGFAYIASRRKSTLPPYLQFILFMTAIIGGLCLLASFFQTGHLAEAQLAGKIAISLHVLAMSSWIGSLYPLWHVSRSADVLLAQTSMKRFGELAIIIVGTLIACGFFISYFLLKHWQVFISSNYGHGLMIKLILVSGLLLIAATNKFFIVPKLRQAGFSNRLSNAIIIEMIVGVLILSTTAVMTTIIGIEANS